MALLPHLVSGGVLSSAPPPPRVGCVRFARSPTPSCTPHGRRGAPGAPPDPTRAARTRGPPRTLRASSSLVFAHLESVTHTILSSCAQRDHPPRATSAALEAVAAAAAGMTTIQSTLRGVSTIVTHTAHRHHAHTRTHCTHQPLPPRCASPLRRSPLADPHQLHAWVGERPGARHAAATTRPRHHRPHRCARVAAGVHHTARARRRCPHSTQQLIAGRGWAPVRCARGGQMRTRCMSVSDALPRGSGSQCPGRSPHSSGASTAPTV